MKIFYFCAMLCLVLAGCEMREVSDTPIPDRDTPAVDYDADKTPTDKTPVAPDNTAVNERDQQSETKTSLDQNENQADIDMTAKIRQEVMDAKLSVNAQNVKIITQNGKVTLRGVVDTAEEKTRIEEIAKTSAGADNVDSQLEVKQ